MIVLWNLAGMVTASWEVVGRMRTAGGLCKPTKVNGEGLQVLTDLYRRRACRRWGHTKR